MFTGVTREDIRRVNDEIGQAIQFQSQQEASHVGNYQNQWQKPITEYGQNDSRWHEQLNTSLFVGKIDFDSSDWAKSRKAVDAVMELLIKELKSQANANYEGLRIDSYVRQGSSREGLKVLKADEFDEMLEFHFDGLEKIQGVDMAYLRGRYPTLYAKSVFIESDGKFYLSSKYLHTKVFQSIVDTATININKAIDHHNRIESQMSKFGLRRLMNPPSVNVKINLKGGVTYDEWGGVKTSEDKEIDLDLVPAFLLRRTNGALLQCPIHAICKWAEEDSFKALEFVDQNLKWDVKSVGYERHILDVARTDKKMRIILTALRIVKTCFVKTKDDARDSGRSPHQIVTVLKSYYLKQAAFYLIMYLCHKYPQFEVNGV
ncbi:hypothetical protein MAR_022691 [Mya arenaria]|uniref:Uncharacterized protein n=1 Tax=Mya arenaria TaxID=6604 RepID=A0ABY7DN60_MYAAR|nr:hypothetical protein MAR_022691 [Mya arenaria]